MQSPIPTSWFSSRKKKMHSPISAASCFLPCQELDWHLYMVGLFLFVIWDYDQITSGIDREPKWITMKSKVMIAHLESPLIIISNFFAISVLNLVHTCFFFVFCRYLQTSMGQSITASRRWIVWLKNNNRGRD